MQRLNTDDVHRPRRLAVLYDGSCGACCAAKGWLADQEAYVPLDLVAAGSAEARERFPGLDPVATREDLTVVADDGRYWSGAEAWIMCLWALYSFRALAIELADPRRRERARRFVNGVSGRRHKVSAMLLLKGEG